MGQMHAPCRRVDRAAGRLLLPAALTERRTGQRVGLGVGEQARTDQEPDALGSLEGEPRPATRHDVDGQVRSVTRGVSASSSVADQLARRFSACSDFEPVSAVKANIVSPVSPESSIVS